MELIKEVSNRFEDLSLCGSWTSEILKFPHRQNSILEMLMGNSLHPSIRENDGFDMGVCLPYTVKIESFIAKGFLQVVNEQKAIMGGTFHRGEAKPRGDGFHHDSQYGFPLPGRNHGLIQILSPGVLINTIGTCYIREIFICVKHGVWRLAIQEGSNIIVKLANPIRRGRSIVHDILAVLTEYTLNPNPANIIHQHKLIALAGKFQREVRCAGF